MFSFGWVVCVLSCTKNLALSSRDLLSSSAPEPAAAAEPAKPAKPAAAKATTAPTESPAAKAATPQSPTPEAIKTAALKALEPLARKVAAPPVLSFPVQITES